MKYYHIGGRVYATESELDTTFNPSLKVLTKAQFDFANANEGATWEEIEKMELTVKVPTLDELKAEKLNALNIHFGTIFAGGYYDDETKWTLFMDEKAVNDYTKAKANILDYADNDECEIGTYTGWHLTTKSVAYPLLARYGKYTMPLITAYTKAEGAIERATASEELEAITW